MAAVPVIVEEHPSSEAVEYGERLAAMLAEVVDAERWRLRIYVGPSVCDASTTPFAPFTVWGHIWRAMRLLGPPPHIDGWVESCWPCWIGRNPDGAKECTHDWRTAEQPPR